MKKIFLGLILLTFTLNCEAKKLYYPIEVVAGMAELIVIGEISSVNKGTYTFSVSETVKGGASKSIKVEMFKEWACDTRIRKIEEGQKLILFLKKKSGKYETINGSAGEIFIIDDRAASSFTDISYPNIDDFKTAVKNFVACYKLEEIDYPILEKSVFIQLKSDKEIKEIKKTSELTSLLFERVKAYKIKA